ncbi:MarR family winged helix-turn-helix transcriptional regulator [Companilactobacillus versmoldensis]|nr:hypothetical protein [Companilactobacillus versmoldensis]
MMNEILNLLNLYLSQDDRNEQEKQWATSQTDSPELQDIIAKLDTREVRIIGLFEINTDVSLKELPQSIGVSQASASRSATKLEDLGVVTKNKTSLNNKEWILSLTDNGEQLLEIKQKLDERHRQELEKISTDYTDEELQHFADLLRRIIKMDRS